MRNLLEYWVSCLLETEVMRKTTSAGVVEIQVFSVPLYCTLRALFFIANKVKVNQVEWFYSMNEPMS